MGLALPIPRYTVKDYLQWEGSWELWDGHPVSMSPSPSWSHQEVASDLHFALKNQLSSAECEDCQIFFELDWQVDDTNVVRPDLLIVCDHPKNSDFVTVPPRFIAEILSPSNPQNDLLVKRTLYESQGVPFYLILDPADSSRHLLLKLNPEGIYEETGDWNIEPHPGCQLSLPKELGN